MNFERLLEKIENSEYKIKWSENRFRFKLKSGRLVRFPRLQLRFYYLTPVSFIVFLKTKRALHIRKDMGYVREFITKRGVLKEFMLSLIRSSRVLAYSQMDMQEEIDKLHPDFLVLRKVFDFDGESKCLEVENIEEESVVRELVVEPGSY